MDKNIVIVRVRDRLFTIHYDRAEAGGYTGQCEQLPAAISQGETLQQLEDNVKEAISLVLEMMDN